VVAETIINVQVEIESLSRYSINVVRLDVLDFDEALACAVAVNAGCLGPQNAIKDQRNAVNVHRCLTK
jgi:hypothetical protein